MSDQSNEPIGGPENSPPPQAYPPPGPPAAGYPAAGGYPPAGSYPPAGQVMGVPPSSDAFLYLPPGVEPAGHGRRIGAYFLAIPLVIVRWASVT